MNLDGSDDSITHQQKQASNIPTSELQRDPGAVVSGAVQASQHETATLCREKDTAAGSSPNRDSTPFSALPATNPSLNWPSHATHPKKPQHKRHTNAARRKDPRIWPRKYPKVTSSTEPSERNIEPSSLRMTSTGRVSKPISKRGGSFVQRGASATARGRGEAMHSRGEAGQQRGGTGPFRTGDVQSRIGNVQVRGGAGQSRDGAVHSRGGTVNSRGGAVHSRGGTVHSRGGAVHSRGGTVHSRGGAVHSRGGTVHSRGVSTPTRGVSEKRLLKHMVSQLDELTSIAKSIESPEVDSPLCSRTCRQSMDARSSDVQEPTSAHVAPIPSVVDEDNDLDPIEEVDLPDEDIIEPVEGAPEPLEAETNLEDQGNVDVPHSRADSPELMDLVNQEYHAESEAPETPNILGDFAEFVSPARPPRRPIEEGAQRDQESQRNSAGSGSRFAKSKKRKEGWNHVTEFVGDSGEKETKCNFCKQQINIADSHTRILKHLIMSCTHCPSPEKRRLKAKYPVKAVKEVISRRECIERRNSIETKPSPSAGGSVAARSQHSSVASAGARERGTSQEEAAVPQITTCTQQDADEITDAILEFIIANAIPFSIMDRVNGERSPFVRLLYLLRPGFASQYLPTSADLSGRILNLFHERLTIETRRLIRESLLAGYGTIIFDGWSDINGEPVINVLLKTEEASEKGRKIFFLRTIYTGAERQGTEEYIQHIEDTINDFGGFEKICAVVSDNAQACLSARRKLSLKYRGVVSVNDQSHVADLLMEDYDKVAWIHSVIRNVASIAAQVHNRKKLLSRFRTLKDDFNKRVPAYNHHLDQEARRRGAEVQISEYCRTAVTLKQMSNTRFASAEGVLGSFVRSRGVLGVLVNQPDFEEELYTCATEGAAANRDADFVNLIKDDYFLLQVKTILAILRSMRRYLRIFDSDNVMISRVVPLTEQLENVLQAMPTNSFLTDERKEEVLEIFKRRKGDASSRNKKVKLLEDVHYAAMLLDPNQAPRDHVAYYPRLQRHLQRYAAMKERAGQLSEEEDSSVFANRILMIYNGEHAWWGQQTERAGGRTLMQMYKDRPMEYWMTRVFEAKELVEFARRKLASSPSSCAAERSFSAQKRVHSKQRNRLKQETVKKIMFCYWNLKLMRKIVAHEKMSRSSFFATNLEADKLAYILVEENEEPVRVDNPPMSVVTAGESDNEGDPSGPRAFEADICDLLTSNTFLHSIPGECISTVPEIEDFIGDEEDEDEELE